MPSTEASSTRYGAGRSGGAFTPFFGAIAHPPRGWQGPGDDPAHSLTVARTV